VRIVGEQWPEIVGGMRKPENLRWLRLRIVDQNVRERRESPETVVRPDDGRFCRPGKRAVAKQRRDLCDGPSEVAPHRWVPACVDA
jgi:hypothetical protein